MSKRTKGYVIIGSAIFVLILLVATTCYALKQMEEALTSAEAELQSLEQMLSSLEVWEVQTYTNPDDGWLENYKLKQENAEAWIRFSYGITDDDKVKINVETFHTAGGYSRCYSEDGFVKFCSNVGDIRAGLLVIMQDNYIFWSLPEHMQTELFKVAVAVFALYRDMNKADVKSSQSLV